MNTNIPGVSVYFYHIQFHQLLQQFDISQACIKCGFLAVKIKKKKDYNFEIELKSKCNISNYIQYLPGSFTPVTFQQSSFEALSPNCILTLAAILKS